MKVLVTGGAGFIGHNVVARLEQLGHSCSVLDNQTNYGIVPTEEIEALHKERRALYQAPLHRISLEDRDENIKWMVGKYQPDVIIHMASFPRQKVVSAHPRWGADVMMSGTMSLLEAAAQHSVKKFIYISSSMVYGDFDHSINETEPCDPIGQYGIMKLAGEQLVKDYNRRGCFDYCIIRPSAVYGPRDITDRVVSKFFSAAMLDQTLKVNGAEEALDFTYVDDVVAGIVASTLDESANGCTFNITRSRARTLLEAAELVVKIVGKGNIQVVERDMMYPSRARLDISLARQVLGYIPQVDIEQGFQKYYEWLQDTIC
jgi:nucleoside-diphosphate-sugar epimerase